MLLRSGFVSLADALQACSLHRTSEAAVSAGVDAIVKEFGALDILVSNAGIQIVIPIVDFSYSDWRKMQATHVDGAFLTAKAAYGICTRDSRGGGAIYMGSVRASYRHRPVLLQRRVIIQLPSSVTTQANPATAP
ncbi:SDR family NAD(P)-dependent oxidoreductase [Paraburkholderia fungorum]|uniref:SDR family NAD(P)-dependent oxidoreductase n=1 Tax=Paraburkholderia fungorum TaxID=134537 RepID=UPI003F494888